MRWSSGVVVRALLVGVWAVSLLCLAYPARVQAQGGGGGTHVVATGETLSQIARQYGTDVSTLMALNGLSNANFVYVGQQLVVSGGGGWEPPQREETTSSWDAPANQRQGVAAEPPASGRPYQRAGVAWEPEATQRSPYRDPVQWVEEPADEDAAVSTDSWQEPRGPRNPYLAEWEEVHNAQSNRAPGSSWEPEASRPASQPASREAEVTGEKWIDIDLTSQTLTAYQGDTEVRSFSISSGSARYPTVTGSFRTYARVDVQDMSGGSQAAGDYYYVEDVPWVQYFFEDYAIHGAYWHNQFGTPIGHGCINMRVEESRWLYDWAGVTGIRVEVHY